MLELGCGMGLCSLLAARHSFTKICATDVNPDALDFVQAHILLNQLQERITVRQLDIREPDATEIWDFICAAELLYLDELHEPILTFLGQCLAPGGKAIFCVDSLRYKPAFDKLAQDRFRITAGKIGVKSGAGQKVERRLYNMMILEKA